MPRQLRAGRWVCLGLAILLPCSAAGAKKKGLPEYVNPDQHVEIAGAETDFSAATRNCLNYGWAAGIETMLRSYRVKMSQADLVTKASGGEKCILDIGDYEPLVRSVEGDYTPEANRRIKISAEFQAGPPEDMGALVGLLVRQKAVMIVLGGRPYLVAGATYDDRFQSAYLHTFLVKKLKLIDLMVPPGKPGRVVEFERTEKTIKAIEAVCSVSVRELRLGELSEGYSH